MRAGEKGEKPTAADELLTRAASRLVGEEREAFLRLCSSGSGDPGLRASIEQRLSTAGGGNQPAGVTPDGPTALAGAPRGPAPAALFGFEGVGSTIGPYRLLDRVGEGGMGEVYRAEQTVPIRRVLAFKLLKLGLNTRRVVARFEAERQALALMDHPGIARVIDAGSTPSGRPFFAMEFVDGVSLTAYCDRHRLSLRDRLRLFNEVCRAVQHAHQKGVIHRDLKPSNILVADGDGAPAAKVIDFGIAKATRGSLTDQTLATGVHQLLGTPAYMGPEQVGGGVDVDTRSDIYALGVVLYELLAGSTPVDPARLARASPAELERILRDEEAEAPSARARALPAGSPALDARRQPAPERLCAALAGDLDWIVLKALEKEPDRRYETADQLAADIGRHLAHEPVLAGPPTRRYRLGKFIRRHRVPLAMGAVAAAALVIGLAASVWYGVRATAAGEEALRARRQGDSLIDFMLTDLVDRLQPIGQVDLLESVGLGVMDYYDGFDLEGRAPRRARPPRLRLPQGRPGQPDQRRPRRGRAGGGARPGDLPADGRGRPRLRG